MKPAELFCVGFTGTRDGMTAKQKAVVLAALITLHPTHARHGLCVGADENFHNLCRELGIYIIGHPGVDDHGKSPFRAHCDVDEMEPELPYHERNDNIIDGCDVLMVTPIGFEEQIRSGTWSTVRKARERKRTIFMVFPDGSTSS